MSKPKNTSPRACLAVLPETLRQFNLIRADWSNTQDAMVNAMMRAWRSMSREDQANAIPKEATIPAADPLVDGNPDTVMSDALQVSAGSLALARVIEKTTRDGDISAADLAEIITAAAKADEKIRKVVAGCREASKRGNSKRQLATAAR